MKRFLNAIYGLQFTPLFDADGNGGGDGGNGGSSNDGANGGANGTNGADEGAKKPEVRTFTQEELDRIVAERIARERKKYDGYDELKAKLAEYEKAEEERKKAAMTEQERLAAEKAEAEKKAQEAEERAQKALQAANERLIKSEFKLIAKELGVRADALDDAYKLADISAVKVGEDGAIEGVKEAVQELIAAKPYLVEQAPKQPKEIGDPNQPPKDSEIKTLEQQLEDARKRRDFSKVVELSNKIKHALGK